MPSTSSHSIRGNRAKSKQNNTLSKRQRQCLQLTAAGFTASAIARQLHISERMVRKHLHCARQKLCASSTVEAVYLATRANLLD